MRQFLPYFRHISYVKGCNGAISFWLGSRPGVAFFNSGSAPFLVRVPSLSILILFLINIVFNGNSWAGQSWQTTETSTTFGFKNSFYAIGFSKENGAIVSITQGTSRNPICIGQQDGLLWNFVLNSRIPELAESENISDTERKQRNLAYVPDMLINPKSEPLTRFQYRWTDSGKQLNLYYYSNNTNIVTIHITPSENNFIDFKADIYNPTSAIGLRFDFPQGLLFNPSELKQFIYPEGIGIAFNSNFYYQNRNSFGHYPALFSDFVSLESKSGNLAIFAIQKPNQFTPADLYTGGANQLGVYEHRFITYISPDTRWSSPIIRFVIGQNTKESLQSYAQVNRFDQSLSLEKKLGKQLFSKVAETLTVKVDHRENKDFDSVTKRLSDLPPNTLLHPVSYWKIGFDRNYPDFLPPDELLGGPENFGKLISSARNKGMLIMPYVNPTWWNESDSLNQVDRTKISSRKLDGTIQKEWYNNNYGYVVTPSNEEVLRTANQLIHRFEKEYPIDILFEDQLGARPWLYDRNPKAPNPTAYVQGIIDMTKAHAKSIPIYTERGIDQLIPYACGFCGLPNLQYPGFAGYHNSWGKGSWSFYPIALYLAHDKVSFYQHDLAVETMAETMEQLSWNILHGFGLTVNLKPDMTNEEKQWFQILGKVQKEICSKYMGLPLLEYLHDNKSIIKSQFGKYSIIANFGTGNYPVTNIKKKDLIIPRGGFIMLDSNNNPIGGTLISSKQNSPPSPTLILFDENNKNKIKLEYQIPTTRLTYIPFPEIKTKQNHTSIDRANFYQEIQKNRKDMIHPVIVNEYKNENGDTEISMMNNKLSVGFNPDLGGRIVYLSTSSGLANQLYLSSLPNVDTWNQKGWYELGGINDWFPDDFPGQVWSNPWHYTITQQGEQNGQVTFWTDVSDSFRIQKSITLPNDKNRVEVHYEIQNISTTPQSFVFNTHPDFAIGNKGIANLNSRLFIPVELVDMDIPFTRTFDKSELLVKDNYCVTYDKSTKLYIIQQFDKETFNKVGIYQSYNFFTMELLGKQQSLAPQEKSKFTIYYILGQGDWKSELI